MKGKGEVKGWITRHGVHVPIYGDYTVRGGVEPKVKGAKVKTGKKNPRDLYGKTVKAKGKDGKNITVEFQRGAPYFKNKLRQIDKNDPVYQDVKDYLEYMGHTQDKNGKWNYKENPNYMQDMDNVRRKVSKDAVKDVKGKKSDFKSKAEEEAFDERERAYEKERQAKKEGFSSAADKEVFDEREKAYEKQRASSSTPNREDFVNDMMTNRGYSKEHAEKAADVFGYENKGARDNDIRATYQRQLDEVNDELESAPKSPRLRNEEGIKELQKKKAALESYLNGTGGIDNKGNAIESKPDFSKMSYSEAGKYVAAHREEFGLSPKDDAYVAAAQMKDGTWKGNKSAQENRDWAEQMNAKTNIDDVPAPKKKFASKQAELRAQGMTESEAKAEVTRRKEASQEKRFQAEKKRAEDYWAGQEAKDKELGTVRKREGRDRILDASTKKEYEAGSRYKTSSSDIPKTTKKISDVLHGDRKTQEWEISKAFDKTSLKELALDIGIPSSRLSGMNTQELRGMLLAILKKGK